MFTDRYKVIQNDEAFAFTDGLLGEGVKYETAGSLQGGIYELLLEMSRRMSKETLEAAIAFPDILEFIYEEWMGYKDSYAEELQFCLNQELGKIRADYRNMKEENER